MFHQACKEQASFIKYMHVGLIKQHQNICIQTWRGLIHVSLTPGQISGSEPYQYHSIVPFLRVSCINVSDMTPSGTPQTLCKRPEVFWMDLTPETDTNRMRQYMNIQVISKPDSGPSQHTTTFFEQYITGAPKNTLSIKDKLIIHVISF